ncbi:hypothetical protein I2750_19665 [Bacillus sp. PR5]|nr:hypothetical protein [Bacillus sp. PR5]
MTNFSEREAKVAGSAQQLSRPPLAAVHQAFYAADELVCTVHALLDTLFGPQPNLACETASPAPEGVIPRLDDLADGMRRRIGHALDRINVAHKEIGR